MPELGNLMQPPRTPIGPAKTAPRPSTQQQQQQPPTTRSLDLENASELELRNKLVEVFRVCWYFRIEKSCFINSLLISVK